MVEYEDLINDPDKPWVEVGRLIEKYGSERDKVAWALCRGQAGEWRIAAEGIGA